MATAKPGYIYDLVTPKGRFLYPSVVEPNDSGQFKSGKFEVTLIFPKVGNEQAYATLMEKAVEAAHQVHPSLPAEAIDIGIRDGDDKDKDYYRGQWIIKAKSNRQPMVFDGLRNQVDPEDVTHGSFGRLSLTAGFYVRGLDKQTADIYRKAGRKLLDTTDENGRAILGVPGVTFYLNRVQVTAPNDGSISGGGGGVGSGSEFPEDDEL